VTSPAAWRVREQIAVDRLPDGWPKGHKGSAEAPKAAKRSQALS